MRVERNIDSAMPELETGDPVDLIVAAQTDLGYKAIVNGRFMGLLYADEVFKPLSYAQELRGWVKKVRDDGKIDLQLTDPLVVGHKSADPIADQILSRLKESTDGFLPINDKTPADDIYSWFGVSRKKFKIALGALYKRRAITVDDDGIRLMTTSSRPGGSGAQKK
jgi:predicted RNA-binding protein (virulence factor B family)